MPTQPVRPVPRSAAARDVVDDGYGEAGVNPDGVSAAADVVTDAATTATLPHQQHRLQQ